MPRKRLRPAYIVKNYTYDCTLLGEPPQALWDTARGMQTLWNGLVAQHDALVAPWDAATTKAQKTAGYEAFWSTAYRYVRDEGERLGLSAWPKWHVYDTFRNAQRAWAKGQRGRPASHQGLRQVLIPHRMQSGGEEVSWLFRDGPGKHTALLPPAPGHHHQEGYITIGGVRVPFRLLLHRPLPDALADAAGQLQPVFLKRVALLGQYEPSLRGPRGNGWLWKFQCTLEIPPTIRTTGRSPERRSIGIDVGWRVREHGLRIAVLTDGTSCWEWRLPWSVSTHSGRKWRKWAFPRGYVVDTTWDWRRLWSWQAELDEACEACKKALQALDRTAWPVEAIQIWQGHVRLGVGGMRRLARVLETAGVACPVLTDWLALHTARQRRLRAAHLHMLRARNTAYRRLADWLGRHWAVVSWEGDLDLKALAESDTTDYALRQSQKYRQMAGLWTLRQYIREALVTYGRARLDTPAHNTTRHCSIEGCPGMIPPTAQLEAQCSEGHWEDQDITAATNLWRAIPAAQRPPVSSRVPGVDRDELQRYLFRLT